MAGARHFLDIPDGESLRDAILVWIDSPFFLSCLALATSFHVLVPFFSNTKQTSWILTTITSAIMSITSLPFLWDYFVGGWSVKNVRTLPTLSVTAVRFFQAHLAADLVLGSIYYRSRISLLEGWIHHLVYILIVQIAIMSSWSHIFCLCASMEIPTFVIGIGTLFPHLRSDKLFAFSFFMARIVLHVILGVSYFSRENRIHATGGSLIPAALLAVIFPLHVSWFVGCVKGFIRRAAQKQTTQPIPIIVPDPRTTTGPEAIALTIHNTELSRLAYLSRRVPSRLRNSLSLKLVHRRQSFERIFRSFRPASRFARQWVVSSDIFAFLPTREAVFYYVGLGREGKQVPPTPIMENGEATSRSLGGTGRKASAAT